MKIFSQVIQGSVITGFLVLSASCVIAPDHEHERDRGEARDHDDRHDDRHCDEHDEHCREH